MGNILSSELFEEGSKDDLSNQPTKQLIRACLGLKV